MLLYIDMVNALLHHENLCNSIVSKPKTSKENPKRIVRESKTLPLNRIRSEYANVPSAARQTINYNGNKRRLFTFYHFPIHIRFHPVAKIHNLDVPFSFFGAEENLCIFGVWEFCHLLPELLLLVENNKKLKVLNFLVQY